VHDRADILKNPDWERERPGAFFDVTERKTVEAALRRATRSCGAVGFARREVPPGRVLDREHRGGARATLGTAADVSRVYLFENSRGPGDLLMDLTYEWCAPGISSTIGDGGQP
jgi:hypothetical protein